MQWFNYKAPAISTPLSGNAIIDSAILENFINEYQANSSLYHCYYDLEKRDTFKDYSGLLKPVFDTIHIDMDSKDDSGAAAWEQTKALCVRLKESGCPFQVYFSGNKGFHIAIHMTALGLTASGHTELSQKIKSFVHGLKSEYSTVDTSIHDPSRKFRAYRSQHEKSGLYKIRLTDTGIRASELTIHEVRMRASKQPTQSYAHPQAVAEPIEWLQSMINATPHQSQGNKKSKVKEVNQGQTIDDDSLKFKNFNDKKCIKQMLDGTVLPQFNRHDLELALIVEMRQVGKTLDEALTTMSAWANKIYKSEPERVADVTRQVRDIYSKELQADKLYQYGCYGDLKSAYCSAKCKIYNSLDKKRRPEPLDCNTKQTQENAVKTNPNLEMSEGELADLILVKFGKEIIKSDQDFFFWENTHWNRMDRDRANAAFYSLASAAYQNKAPFNKIESLVRQIKIKIPVAPEHNHFYTSSPNLFNFTDGTVIVTKEDHGQMKLTLKAHDRTDLLGYCAPFPFAAENQLPRNGQTAKYFESRLLDLGPDGVRMMKQMLGAALIPYKPWIFFLIGDSDSGKSTMALMIKSLLGERNVSGVEPVKSGNSFMWESAIGKIANIATELPKDTPLDVNTLKKIRDKTPQFINRKGVKAVEATLPFLHIYCANILPSSFEGNTGALDNRMTVLKFKKVYVNGLADIDNLGQWLWDQDAGSILAYAREGLADLAGSGFKYYRSETSLKNLAEWQDETDPVKTFVKEVETGEHTFSAEIFEVSAVKFVKAKDIFTAFKLWAEENKYKAPGKVKFFRELERCVAVKMERHDAGNGFRWKLALEAKSLADKPVSKTAAERGISAQPF